MLRLLFVPLVFLVTACSSNFATKPSESSPTLDLAAAKSKWAATKASVGSYKLYLGYSGVTGYFKVISGVDSSGLVVDCVEAYRDWSAQAPTYKACPSQSGSTVENLFDRIEDAIIAGSSAHVEYDPTYGVPTSIFLREDNGGVADAGTGSFVAIDFDFPTP
jgi:hypothetical protein